jgi:endoglucanase
MIRSFISLFVLLSLAFASNAQAQAETVVEKHGQLRVQGNRIVDASGAPVQLRGMSLYWSQWIPKYYNANTVRWLRDDWKITVIRAAMAVKPDGYEKNPEAERKKVIAVVDAAIQLGLYVIIDYHAHTAHENRAQAQAFFADMARRYGNTPNVLYEPYHEPLDVSWSKVLKPYHEAVIDSIRAHDPDNIVIVGTRNWSQQVAEAAADPIQRSNVAYTLHFYANTHGQSLRDDAQKALNRGVALFATEYGTTDATGDGVVNESATRQWWAFLDRNFIGHLNWSVADIRESSAALMPGASPDGGWGLSQIKPSGLLVREELRARALAPVTTPPKEN